MKDDRFNMLLGRVAEGDSAPSEADELARLLETHPEWIPDAQSQLELSDWMSQEMEPARRSEAFLAAMETRFEAESTKTRFVERTVSSIRTSEASRRPAKKAAGAGWLLPLAAAAGIAAILAAWLMVDGGWLMGRGEGVRGKPTSLKLRRPRGQVIARVERASGQWPVDSGQYGKKTLKVGDAVRSEDRIEVGEKGAVVLAWVGKETRVELGGGSVFWIQRPTLLRQGYGGQAPNIQHPTSKLEKGKLTAHVEKRSALDGPFVVETPHARMEVLGTRFGVRVERGTTRVEVLKGLVRFERLSDRKAINVAGGQYAVAAQDVELAALALPEKPGAERKSAGAQQKYPKPMERRYGRILFEDHFDQGLDKWEVLTKLQGGAYTVRSEMERLAPIKDNYVYKVKANRGLKDPWRTWDKRCVMLDTDSAGLVDTYLAIRSREEIDADRFVVEVTCLVNQLDDQKKESKRSGIETCGIELLEKAVILERPGSMGLYDHVFRWEFEPLEGRPGKMLCRFFKRHGKSFSESSHVRPASKRILLGIANAVLAIDSVVVREILDDTEHIETPR